MGLSLITFGLLSNCFLAVLVGILGSGRRIGFGWTFLISLIFTPFIGLIFALISDPLPVNTPKRWGCLGILFGLLGMIFLVMFVLALLGVAIVI